MNIEKAIKECKHNLNVCKEENVYYKEQLNKNWVEDKLQINPYISQDQIDIIKFKEKFYKEKCQTEIMKNNESIEKLNNKIEELKSKINVENKEDSNIYKNVFCEFKKNRRNWNGFLCFEKGLKSFSSINEIEKYINKNIKTIMDYWENERVDIPDLFGNSISITHKQYKEAVKRYIKRVYSKQVHNKLNEVIKENRNYKIDLRDSNNFIKFIKHIKGEGIIFIINTYIPSHIGLSINGFKSCVYENLCDDLIKQYEKTQNNSVYRLKEE